jgi:acyl carrier protein
MNDRDTPIAGSPDTKPRPRRWLRRLRPATFVPAAGFADAAALESWMKDWLACKLDIPAASIDRNEPLIDFGLDSLAAVGFSGDLEVVIGRPISPSIAWEFPTIAEAAAHIFAGGGGMVSDMDA